MDSSFFSFADIKTLLLITHLFGIAFGAGGAFLSDALFFKAMRDFVISKTEMNILMTASWFVTVGLALLLFSGAGMFLLDTEKYLASTKFLAKMTIVGVIIANGFLLHFSHIPRLKRHVGAHLLSSDEFRRHRTPLLWSGVLSFISWCSAIVLGAFRSLPFSYGEIMSLYILLLFFGFTLAFSLRNAFLPAEPRHVRSEHDSRR